MNKDFYIDPDIRKAHTLPSVAYTEQKYFDTLKHHLFSNSWQWLGGKEYLSSSYTQTPHTFLPGCIDEPLLIVRNQEHLSCLSNVCTHRAKILIESPSSKPFISCSYHGRCFHNDGRFRSMPEFDSAQDFPSPQDDLKKYHLSSWNDFFFVALKPKYDLHNILTPIQNHLGSYTFSSLDLEPNLSKTYHIHANWLTYCDNYLEGFHIPYVHPTLNKAITYEDYEVRVFDHCNVQIGRCKPGQKSIPLQKGDPDFGENIYAYYWFSYPNLMLNFYHWGISINWVIPKNINETEVRFLTFKRQDIPDSDFAETALDLTEMEDEAVVESVQKGLMSLAYSRGRFSPTREQGVHAFHRYLYTEVFSDSKNIAP
ncbi:MAG: Rieske 2Fe-2S domain-containing protein [Saprospiraceae bacterium]|nr:Rieske 2Fe-2S domain-containing protein [Saprospiraceae bacterium]